MATEKVNVELRTLLNSTGWEKISKILKDRRDELAAKIIYNTDVDEKIYSEADMWKLEVRQLNRLLKLPTIIVEIDKEITDEEIIARENDELDIGDVDELFKTRDA